MIFDPPHRPNYLLCPMIFTLKRSLLGGHFRPFLPTLKHVVINGCSLFITEEDIQKLMTMLKLLLPKETLLDRQEYYHAVI